MAQPKPLLRLTNTNQVLYALRRTDASIKAHVERASDVIAVTFVQDARRTAAPYPQSAMAATSARVRKGLVPKVAVGGGGRAPSTTRRRRLPTFGDVFFGNEFGSTQYRQFPPPARGRWFYGTLNRNGRQYVEMWIDAVDKALYRSWRN